MRKTAVNSVMCVKAEHISAGGEVGPAQIEGTRSNKNNNKESHDDNASDAFRAHRSGGAAGSVPPLALLQRHNRPPSTLSLTHMF